jgi:hypothetical protein
LGGCPDHVTESIRDTLGYHDQSIVRKTAGALAKISPDSANPKSQSRALILEGRSKEQQLTKPVEYASRAVFPPGENGHQGYANKQPYLGRSTTPVHEALD